MPASILSGAPGADAQHSHSGPPDVPDDQCRLATKQLTPQPSHRAGVQLLSEAMNRLRQLPMACPPEHLSRVCSSGEEPPMRDGNSGHKPFRQHYD